MSKAIEMDNTVHRYLRKICEK